MLITNVSLGPRQQRRYVHAFDIWRSTEAAHVLNGKFGGITWEQIGAAIRAGTDPGPSHVEPTFPGPQVETDILVTLDKVAFHSLITIRAGDVLKMVGAPSGETRIGKFWMVRGYEEPHVVHAKQAIFLTRILVEGPPPGVA